MEEGGGLMTQECILLDSKIKQRGLRMTRQRAAVLEVLSQIKGHPKAEDIYRKLHRRMPQVSFGTVYRSLKLLEELGFARELRFGKRHSRYERNPSHHQHFTCSVCGEIMDIDEPIPSPPNELMVGGAKLRVDGVRLDYYGICERCDGKSNKQTP
jgi:Fur family peroxide stress response transcriptional regulator